MSDGNYVHLEECEIKAVTDKAILIRYEDRDIWCPKSQVADAEDYKRGMTDRTVSVTEWFAKKEGLD